MRTVIAEASLRPGPLPSPGAMPPGSTMAAIAERGRLIVGVDQNTYLFGFRNPASGQLEGFDIDLAREIARHIFGDPDRIQLRVVDASQRESALQSGLVDLVVRTYTITCARKEKVDFSTVYYYAHQRILSVKGSGIDSAAALSGKRVCAVSGTTSLSRLFALNPRPTLFGVSTWTDCLLLLQQGQVDAISTDDAVLAGLAAQDPNVEVVGPRHERRALRRRRQEGEQRPGSIRQRSPRADARRRNMGAPLRRPSAKPRPVAWPADGELPGLTMTVLTTDEIDRELASRAKEVASMSATLVELDNHAGLVHVRRYPPTGVTAQRWTVIEKSLSQLWEDLGRMTSILESAQTLRARRSKPDDDDRAELTRLLRERPLEVSRERIPLAQRQISGPGEAVEYVGLADTAERMRSAYPAVIEFLDAVDGINSLIAERLAPSQQRLDEAGVAGPKEMAELLAVSATDPLSLTERDVEKRVIAIADSIERQSRELADLAALQANWPDALAKTALQLDALRDAAQHAAQVRARAPSKWCWPARSRCTPTPNRLCARSYGRSPHRIPRRCCRCSAGSRRRCGLRGTTRSSRRACLTAEANSRDG